MPENKLNCNLSLPYPRVCTADLNRYDAQMIRTLLARKLYAINEYIIQSILLADDHACLADMIDCIALTEVKHFKLLGRLLYISGEEISMREFKSESAKCGNGRKCGQSTVCCILSQNMEREKNSISDIRLVLSQVHDGSAKAVLKRILADEEHHAELFAQLKKRYS